MSQAFTDPRHPHRSILVAAAAGSGKTYQLSQRFLHLVAAGASPASILTVTFTIKAAGEMRARILKEAADLKRDPEKRERFAADTHLFHAEKPGARPPLSPDATADAILAQSQALRITTIDAIFLEWVAKFPYESDGETPLPIPLSLADPRDAKRYDDQAFRALGAFISGRLTEADEATRAWFSGIPNQAFMDLKAKMRALSLQDTFLWYAASLRGGDTPYALHHVEQGLPPTVADAMTSLRQEWTAIVAAMKGMGSHAAALQALATLDAKDMQAARLLTKDMKINGATLKGPRRAGVADQVAAIEDILGRVERRERLERLNDLGARYVQSYAWYAAARDAIKHQAGVAEFPDLAKGSFRLWHGEAGAGVRYLLSRTIRHIMLDEFQDTSRLQWSIFQAMAAELLAGDQLEDGGPAPSAFIVGDEKQSIYGFREADPTVMGAARAAFAGRMIETPLTASYRTAQIALDYVNACFELGDKRPLSGFFPHTTALKAGTNVPVVPDTGRVVLGPVVKKSIDAAGRVTTAVQAEAELVADLIQAALAGDLACPVYDKKAGVFRKLTPRDCAILYRASTNAHEYEQALRTRHIPCERDEDKGFFLRAEVADVVATLKFLAMPADLVALATLLRSPFGALSDEALTALLWPTSRYGASQPFGPERAAAVMDALAAAHPQLATTLIDLMALASRSSPHIVLTETLRRFSVLDRYSDPAIYGAKEAEQARHNLSRLVELVCDGETKGHVSLVTMLTYLDTLKNDDETGNARTGADAVNLLTVHKSKGLEFPLVVVVDTNRPWGKLDPYFAQGEADDGLPAVYFVGSREDAPQNDPGFEALKQRTARAIADECERLLYVAMTRAEQHLFITAHEGDAGARQGLSDTAPYARLAAGFDLLSSRRASSVWTTPGQVDTPCRMIAVAPPTLKPAKAAPKPEIAAPDLVALASQAGRSAAVQQVKIVTPSDEAPDGLVGTSGLRSAALPEDGSPKRVGEFIHAGLEAAARGTAFAHAEAYDRLIGGPRGALHAWAKAHVERAVASDYWRHLVSSAKRLVPEVAIAHRQRATSSSPDQLVSGRIDLLVYDKDGSVRVIDFKTTNADGLDPTAAVRVLSAFAREKGYDRQLRSYRDAVAAMHPGVKVTAEIFFTGPGVAIQIS